MKKKQSLIKKKKRINFNGIFEMYFKFFELEKLFQIFLIGNIISNIRLLKFVKKCKKN